MPSSRSLVPLGLRAYGGLQVVQGAWMALSPSSFFDAVGPFGTQNDHYIRDASTWSLALGALCLLAATRSPWRLPVLALAALQAGLHTVNHLVDVGDASSTAIGVFDAASLALLTVLLLSLARQEVSR